MFQGIQTQPAEKFSGWITHSICHIAVGQLMKNDGISQGYGNQDEGCRIFQQQFKQAHINLSPGAVI